MPDSFIFRFWFCNRVYPDVRFLILFYVAENLLFQPWVSRSRLFMRQLYRRVWLFYVKNFLSNCLFSDEVRLFDLWSCYCVSMIILARYGCDLWCFVIQIIYGKKLVIFRMILFDVPLIQVRTAYFHFTSIIVFQNVCSLLSIPKSSHWSGNGFITDFENKRRYKYV